MDHRIPDPPLTAADLYEADYYAWVLGQAEALRALARVGRSNLPLDLENLAEEVEDMGRNEVDKAESLVEQILIHLLKLTIAPDHTAAQHWRHEVMVFRRQLLRRHWTRTLQRKVAESFDDIWLAARLRAADRLSRDVPDAGMRLPADCPWSLDQIVAADDPDRV